MKLDLSEEQAALLHEIGAPYIPDKDYNVDALGDLEEYISDYALMEELDSEGMTERGEGLIDIVSHLAELSFLVE